MHELKIYRGVKYHDNKEWCKIWRGIDLSVQNWHGELFLMALKIDAKFEGKLTCAFQNDMKNLSNFIRLKNSDSILESKTAKLNQNKNSYVTTRSTRCTVKTLFYLGNKWIAQLTELFPHVLQNSCS